MNAKFPLKAITESGTQIDVDAIVVADAAVTAGSNTVDLSSVPASVDWGDINGTLADQTDLQAALDLKANLSPTIRTITAATDTITSADNGKVIYANRATDQTLTVTGPIAAGFNCLIIQADGGQTIFAAGGGATVLNRQSHTKIAGENGIASLVCGATDSVILAGDTAA